MTLFVRKPGRALLNDPRGITGALQNFVVRHRSMIKPLGFACQLPQWNCWHPLNPGAER